MFFSQITRDFYLCFWSLSLSDIFLPEALYKATIKEVEAKGSDKFTASRAKQIRAELEAQRRHVERSLARIQREAPFWFDPARFEPPQQHAEEGFFSTKENAALVGDICLDLLRNCFLPRCGFSAADALYCAKLIELLLRQAPPFFPNRALITQILTTVLNSLRTRTEAESKCYGIFLREILRLVYRWYGSEAAFTSESGQAKTGEHLTAEDRHGRFKGMVDRNYNKAFLVFANSTLSSDEYHELSNGLLVLFEIKDMWPHNK